MRIALIGSAPSSVQLAPYADPSWKIWSVSPGAAPMLKRTPDAHFELHRWEPPVGYTGQKPWFTPEYLAWMAKVPQVFMIEHVPQIPNSVPYPRDAMLEAFGPYFQTSSVSWMVCLAVAAGAKEIALWGIDMSAREEWAFQRTGLQTLLWYVNKHYGVKITIPPESDLWVPPPLYGFCEADPKNIKLMRRKEELAGRIQIAQNNLEVSQREMLFLQGAQDNNDYQLATWCIDEKSKSLAFAKPAWATVPLDPVIEELVNGGLPPVNRNGHAADDFSKMAAAIERVDGEQAPAR